jgi:hypothetical protein
MFTNRIPLFTLFGIKVGLDYSWFFLAILLVWSLMAGYFPWVLPGLDTASYLWMAILGAAGLFASIIFHEYAHALVARRYDLPISRITLFIFGGVAEMDDEPKTAAAEFWMAIAGPIASFRAGCGHVPLAVGRTVRPRVAARRDHRLPGLHQPDPGRVQPAARLPARRRAHAARRRVALHRGLPEGDPHRRGDRLGARHHADRARRAQHHRRRLRAGHLADAHRLLRLFGRRRLAGARRTARHPARRAGQPHHAHELVTVPADTPVQTLVDEYFYRHFYKVFPVVDGTGRPVGVIGLKDVANANRDDWRNARAPATSWGR